MKPSPSPEQLLRLPVLPRRAVVAAALGTASAAWCGWTSTAALATEAPPPRRAAAAVAGFPAYEAGEGVVGGYNLRRVARDIRRPGPGEARLRVRATGLNARDLSLLRGVRIYGSKDGPGRIPLDDNACEVLELGAGVSGLAIGERVVCSHFPLWLDGAWDDAAMSRLDFGVNADGFLAGEAVVPAQGLVRIPDGMPFEQAATFPNAGLTAWHAVVEGAQVKPGDTLVTLGTGGVSMFGLQWAKMLGARVVVTSSSDAKLARLRALGADVTINYRTRPAWHEAVLEATGGRGADVVLNTVGIGELERCLMACASNARVMQIGANPVARGAAAPRAPGAAAEAPVGLRDFPRGMIMRGLRIQGVIVGSRRMLESALQAAALNRITPVIDRVFAFDEALEALRYMEGGEKIGKVVIRGP